MYQQEHLESADLYQAESGVELESGWLRKI